MLLNPTDRYLLKKGKLEGKLEGKVDIKNNFINNGFKVVKTLNKYNNVLRDIVEKEVLWVIHVL